MTFAEIHCLNIEKIHAIKSMIRFHGIQILDDLRQSPEQRRARIEAHKNGYKEAFMDALSKATEDRWDKKEAESQIQQLKKPSKSSNPKKQKNSNPPK